MFYCEKPNTIDDLLYTNYLENQWWVFNKRKYVVDYIIRLLTLRFDSYDEFKLETKCSGLFDDNPLRYLKNEDFLSVLDFVASFFSFDTIESFIKFPDLIDLKKSFIHQLIEKTVWDDIIWKCPSSLVVKTPDLRLSGKKSEYLVFDIGSHELKLVWRTNIHGEETDIVSPTFSSEELGQGVHFQNDELKMLKELYECLSTKIRIKGISELSMYWWTEAWGIKRRVVTVRVPIKRI